MWHLNTSMKTSKVVIGFCSIIIALLILSQLLPCRPQGETPNTINVGNGPVSTAGEAVGDLETSGEDEQDMGGPETYDDDPRSYSLPLDLMKCDNCFRWRHPLRLQPRQDLCWGAGGAGHFEAIDLLILCNTKHTNTQHRKVLRDIYNRANIKGHTVRLMFLFGEDPGGDQQLEEALVQESVAHGDILQTVVNGTYHNLTLLVTNGYQWALDHCPRARFTAKISDDHLMNLIGVLDLLDQFGDTQLHDVVFGWCDMRPFPFRSRTNKMYMNYQMYPFALLPNFCAGACLLISMITVREIMKEAGNLAYPTMMDDANIGIMTEFTGHQTCHIPNVEISLEALEKLFTNNSRMIGDLEICAAVRSEDPTLGIHLHGFEPGIMKTIWENCGNFHQHLVVGSLPISCPRRKAPYVKGVLQGQRWIQNQDL